MWEQDHIMSPVRVIDLLSVGIAMRAVPALVRLKRRIRPGRFGVIILSAIVMLLSSASRNLAGDFDSSAAVGVFAPYRGTPGPQVDLQLSSGDRQSRERLVFELEYRGFETSTFGVDDVHFDTLSARAMFEFVLRPGRITPYVGGGFGVTSGFIDDERVREKLREEAGASSTARVGSFDFAVGVLGLAGVEMPLGSRVAAFAEARVSSEFALTGSATVTAGETEYSPTNLHNLGGFAGIGGVRVRF